VPIARTGTSDNHVSDGVVVLLLDLLPLIEEIVAEGVELGEVDSEVRHLQEILDLLRIGVIDLEVLGQHSEDELQQTST